MGSRADRVGAPVGADPGRDAERSGFAAAALVSSYVLLLAVVAVNRRVPGAALMAAGLTMNLAVVALNGGMPVGREAIRAAGANGVIVIEDGAKHHLMSNADVLRPLADVVPVPPPFGAVFSIGDILLYGGLAWWCFAVTRGRFRANIRPPARRFLMYRGSMLRSGIGSRLATGRSSREGSTQRS